MNENKVSLPFYFWGRLSWLRRAPFLLLAAVPSAAVSGALPSVLAQMPPSPPSPAWPPCFRKCHSIPLHLFFLSQNEFFIKWWLKGDEINPRLNYAKFSAVSGIQEVFNKCRPNSSTLRSKSAEILILDEAPLTKCYNTQNQHAVRTAEFIHVQGLLQNIYVHIFLSLRRNTVEVHVLSPHSLPSVDLCS